MDPKTQVSQSTESVSQPSSQPVPPLNPQPLQATAGGQPVPANPVATQSQTLAASQPSTFSAPPEHVGNPLKKVLLAFLFIIILGGIAGGSYYLGTQNELANIPGMTPPKMAAKKVTITQVPTPTPTPNPTVNWTVYSNAKYGYSVKYPTTLVAKEDNTYYHYVTFSATGSALPAFLVSVIPETFVTTNIAAYNYMSSDWINTFTTLQTGQSKTDGATIFTKLADTVVAGQPAMNVGVTSGTNKEQRVYVRAGGNIYMLSNNYTTPDELNNFTLFLSTFQLTQ